HSGHTDHTRPGLMLSGASGSTPGSAAAHPDSMQVIELKNYLLQPGRASEFIQFFEENFLEALARHGMPILGHFEVVGEPDRFFFIRSFPDMVSRLRSLKAYYDSAYWH